MTIVSKPYQNSRNASSEVANLYLSGTGLHMVYALPTPAIALLALTAHAKDCAVPPIVFWNIHLMETD